MLRRRTTTTALRPAEQLSLYHAELVRQLADNAARQQNMITRASILVAAAGVFAAILSGGLASGWQWVSVALALIAAACALRSIWLWRTRSGNVLKVDLNSYLVNGAYDIEYGIVIGSREELRHGQIDLKRKARWVRVGFCILALSWPSTSLFALLLDLKIL